MCCSPVWVTLFSKAGLSFERCCTHGKFRLSRIKEQGLDVMCCRHQVLWLRDSMRPDGAGGAGGGSGGGAGGGGAGGGGAGDGG